MLFTKQTFVLDVSLEAKGANPRQVTVNIASGEVADEIVIASSIAGNSPRVRLQSQIRRDGFPLGMILNLTAAEWFGSPRLAAKPRVYTPEELFAAAVANGDVMAQMVEYLKKQQAIGSEQTDEPGEQT